MEGILFPPNKKEPHLSRGIWPPHIKHPEINATPYAGINQVRFKGYLLSLIGTPGYIELYDSIYPDSLTKSREKQRFLLDKTGHFYLLTTNIGGKVKQPSP